MTYLLIKTGRKLIDKEKDKKSSLPSAKNMREFCHEFSTEQWSFLCRNKEFMSSVDNNLSSAAQMAQKLLNPGKKIIQITNGAKPI